MKKSDLLIEKSLEVLGGYEKVTLRQLYYRLVSALIIPNTLNEYKGLSKVLSKARYAGVVPFDAFEDLNRTADVNGTDANTWSPERALDSIVDDVTANLDGAGSYSSHPFWWGQDKYIEVWEEKQALQSQFSKALRGLDVTLVVCRGYPSVTLLYEAAERIQEVQADDPDREAILKYFGDFDPTGKDISRNVIETLEDEFGLDITFERVALEQRHIDKYNLPHMPVKMSDVRAKKYIAEHGNVAVELDALDPEVLHEVIRGSILEEIDQDIMGERKEKIEENREAIKTLVKEHDWTGVVQGVLDDL